MGTTIFYFTGTGNSLMIAKDIAAELDDARLVSIPNAVKADTVEMSDERIGFVFPVYYWGLPLIVADFIRGLKFTGQEYVFGIANIGGTTGGALNQLAKLVAKGGGKLAAGFSVVMPDNYINMFDPLDNKAQQELFRKERQRAKEIAACVKAHEHRGIEKQGSGITRALAPVAYLGSRKFYRESRSFWVTDKCNGCGNCKLVCPVNNVEIVEGKPVWQDKCQQCMACIQWCPKEALQYSNKSLKRARYRNPNVKLKDIISSSAKG